MVLRPMLTDRGTPEPALSQSANAPATSQVEGETLPSATGEVSLAATEITEALGQQAEFGSIGVNQAGEGLVLYRHSKPPSTLTDIQASHPDLPIEVRPTKYLPGDLRAAARRLLAAEADAGVGAVAPKPDGTGLTVMVDKDEVRENLNELAVRLSSDAGFPVSVEAGAPVAAN